MKDLRNLLLIVILVICDQLSKWYFLGKNIKIFSYFSFNSLTNTGITFGIFKNNNWIFILSSILIICLIMYFYNKEKKYNLIFCFLLAGAFGNLIDRIFRGFVVDFIDFKFWYVFNLADAFVVAGMILLVCYLIKEKG